MNASFWHHDTVHELRSALFAEHLGTDTATMSASAAAEVFHEQSRHNAALRADGQPLEGLAHQLDPTSYGYDNPKAWTRPSLL